jgi:hypothetical protein
VTFYLVKKIKATLYSYTMVLSILKDVAWKDKSAESLLLSQRIVTGVGLVVLY